MRNVWILSKRELSGYFSTPVAYVFLFFFLVLIGFLTFYVTGFYERGVADLQPFFALHPWLYLFLIPAISMRLWAEERKSGTFELLLTLPISMGQAVLGKFLAAWIFSGIALLLTFPLWITVNYLGQPDNGVIVASYVGSFLIAGAYLALGSLLSATTKNQVIAFVLTFFVGLLFVLAGTPLVLEFVRNWLPDVLADLVRSFSFLTHMSAIGSGVIEVRSLAYFGALIAACLFACVVTLDLKKAS
jgi:ABC-2 type transport system permease protein